MFKPLIDECKLRNYSPKTIKAYLHYNQKFLLFCRKKTQEVCREDIRGYLLYLESKNKSSSLINLAHNALNFYYKDIMGRKFKPIRFQKREDKLVSVLSMEEVKRLIDVVKNKKHRLIISLLYATGIRVAELVKVKIVDLDFDRKMLLVKQGKGKKDRYTILSDKIIKEIKDFLEERKFMRKESKYLFAGGLTEHISIRTVQIVLNNAARKAKIMKKVTPHKMRHSFATHLMESGVEDSKIQKMLGHKDIKTTQRYARVTNKHIRGVKSPHDLL